MKLQPPCGTSGLPWLQLAVGSRHEVLRLALAAAHVATQAACEGVRAASAQPIAQLGRQVLAG